MFSIAPPTAIRCRFPDLAGSPAQLARAQHSGAIGELWITVITGGLVLAPISIWCLVGAIALPTATAWITVAPADSVRAETAPSRRG